MTNPQDTSIKILTPTVHGIFDYLIVIGLFVAPSLIGGISTKFTAAIYVFAALFLALTLATRFSAGMFSGISFRTHGVIELLLSLFLVISPWIVGFADVSVVRNLAVLTGVVIFFVWLLTGYQPEVREDAGKEAGANEGVASADGEVETEHSSQESKIKSNNQNSQ